MSNKISLDDLMALYDSDFNLTVQDLSRVSGVSIDLIKQAMYADPEEFKKLRDLYDAKRGLI